MLFLCITLTVVTDENVGEYRYIRSDHTLVNFVSVALNALSVIYNRVIISSLLTMYICMNMHIPRGYVQVWVHLCNALCVCCVGICTYRHASVCCTLCR